MCLTKSTDKDLPKMNKNLEMFENLGYCVVKNAINQDIIDIASQYALFDEFQNFNGTDEQVEGAHSKYADPLMEVLLLKLHAIMERNTGLELDPTYSYYRVYRPGDELRPHTDRPSCEISCTMHIGNNNDKIKWPIFMNGGSIEQSPGDIVIYKGIDLEHWREPLDCDDPDFFQVQGFFHFVNKNGPHAEWRFDKRNHIGEHKKILPKNEKKSSKHYIEYTR